MELLTLPESRTGKGDWLDEKPDRLDRLFLAISEVLESSNRSTVGSYLMTHDMRPKVRVLLCMDADVTDRKLGIWISRYLCKKGTALFHMKGKNAKVQIGFTQAGFNYWNSRKLENVEPAPPIVLEPSTDEDASSKKPIGLITNMDDVDRRFDDPRPLEMPDLDAPTLRHVREAFSDGATFVPVGLLEVLQGYNPSYYEGGVGRKRSDHIFLQLKQRQLVKANSFDGTFSLVSEKSEEAAELKIEELESEMDRLVAQINALEAQIKDTLQVLEDSVVIRPDDFNELPDELNVLRVLVDKDRPQFFRNLVRLVQTQREIIGKALDAVPMDAHGALQLEIAEATRWIDEFFKE